MTTETPKKKRLARTSKADVVNGVTKYVTRVYGDGSEDSFHKAFNDNDADKDGRISLSELVTVLGKSDVGWILTRPAIASTIIQVLDTNGDGYVEWAEFLSVFKPT